MPKFNISEIHYSYLNKQRGAVLMIMLVIIILSTTAFLVSALSRASMQRDNDKITADALAQAKEALIGYATSVKINFSFCAASGNNCNRLGDLPCPDTDNDGKSNSPCGDDSGSDQSLRLGRLPWKTLGIPDLRDASGERLWYAVSNNFKDSTRTICNSPGQAGCLNSDTVGTITIRNPDGSIINNASLGQGIAAVIIAPGNILQRQGAASLQNRNCTQGVDCDTQGKCITPTAPKCDPHNYLDNTPAGTNFEDNAAFIDNSPSDGFIQGIVKDSNGKIIVNDQLVSISQDSIMQTIQKRVANEVKQCLIAYADPVNGGFGRYPWAAKLDSTLPVNYTDTASQLFGRLPDALFTNTCLSSGGYANGHAGNNCSNNPIAGMNNIWPASCNINTSNGWWNNWKEMVFYGLASAYKPITSPATPTPCPAIAPCIAVNPPSAIADKKFVVIVAGKTLPGKSRSNNMEKGTLSNYLEGINTNGATSFEQQPVSSTFNDTVTYQ